MDVRATRKALATELEAARVAGNAGEVERLTAEFADLARRFPPEPAVGTGHIVVPLATVENELRRRMRGQ